jgi:hypothetical protein
LSFNTRGYFDPTLCEDEHFINEKLRVFEKYRSKRNEIVMLDLKNTNRSLLIQKGLVKPATAEYDLSSEKTTDSLLRSYLLRKEKHASHEQEKYAEIPKFALDPLSLRSNTISSRTSNSRQIASRISTTSVLKLELDF